ncbi:MAG: response regulator [Phycisphaerae bacterium]
MTEGSEEKQNKANVLLVDDDEEILFAMESAFRPMKEIILDRATNGNQAVDKVDKIDPDVVVLDMMLPKKSGFLVMERIRQRRERLKSKRPYVIMVTGNTGQRHKDYAKSLGVNDYINKPFRMEKLTTAVKNFLTQAQEDKKLENPEKTT